MIKEKDGKKYLIIGNKAIPFNSLDKNGKPIIKVETEHTFLDGFLNFLSSGLYTPRVARVYCAK